MGRYLDILDDRTEPRPVALARPTVEPAASRLLSLLSQPSAKEADGNTGGKSKGYERATKATKATKPSPGADLWLTKVARLNPLVPPADFPAQRWRTLVDDIICFLASGFAAQAKALRWSAEDLFGCDRDRPYSRIDKSGLLLLLNGDRVVALSEQTAIIETRAGARQTYRREPGQQGRALLWELAP